MIVLNINNSECRILGLSVVQFKELQIILSYEIPIEKSYYSGNPYKKTSLLSSKGFFPTGLLYLVEGYLKTKSLQVDVKNHCVRPTPVRDRFKARLKIVPYLEQLNATKACLRESRGIIVAPTGLGKSLIVALIIQELQVPTLVVVPTLELKRQLRESLKAIFGSLEHIDVENVDSLSPKKQKKHYDCVIIDEFHHSGARSYRNLNKTAWNDVYYKFGLTATPFRSQDHERLLLESVLSKVIYQITYQTAVSKGYIVPMDAYYIELPKTLIQGNQKSWPAMYSELVVKNTVRNKIISGVLRALAEKSTLCLVKEIKHGLEIGGSFAHGENENTPHLITLFNSGKLKTLIGTTGVLGEGVDTRPAEFVIIAGLGKSKNQFMQSVGRTFRHYPGKTSAKIIIIKDSSHKWTKEHFKVQCKILLDEYGIIPVKLEY